MRTAALLAVLVVAYARPAGAQVASPPGRVEIGGGVSWIGSSSLGTSEATETTSGGSTSRLFSTSSELGGAIGFGLHVGVRLTPALELIAGATRAKPSLRTTISSDIENSTTETAEETVTQYTVSGGALWYLPGRSRPRLRPFLSGSIGYLRQLHDTNTLAETGQIYTIGGGAKYLFTARTTGRRKAVGVRGDAAVVIRTGGVSITDGAQYAPQLQASIFVRF